MVMHVTIVYIKVQPGFREDFITASRQNHNASCVEDGNMRFDVLQLKADPNQFVLGSLR
jgi:quinol monooxygenase YgiN